jgi:hypothetical protein
MELVIDRSKWIRGKGGAASCLLCPSDGKMCCLGFYSLACGLTEKQIKGAATPVSLGMEGDNPLNNTEGSWLLREGVNSHTLEAKELMALNDDSSISDQVREDEITRIFATRGVTVKFVDSASE